MRDFTDREKTCGQGEYAELLHEMGVLLYPRVREVFEPILLVGTDVDPEDEASVYALNSALETITWKLFEMWAVILWDASENDPAKILRLETLDHHMLPRGDLSAWFSKAEEEMDVLTEERMRETLRRLRKCFPPGTFLPQQMAELIRLEGNLAVTCH